MVVVRLDAPCGAAVDVKRHPYIPQMVRQVVLVGIRRGVHPPCYPRPRLHEVDPIAGVLDAVHVVRGDAALRARQLFPGGIVGVRPQDPLRLRCPAGCPCSCNSALHTPPCRSTLSATIFIL